MALDEPSTRRGELPKWFRLVLALALLYVFLIGVGLLEGGIRQFGEGFETQLLASVGNPLAGLLAGIGATVLVQSSSISTATIVGLVGSGTLPVSLAVPMIMGANIGTTITNTLVSLGSLRRPNEFRRAFAAATMHDFFNLMAVAVLLPVELLTGVISAVAEALADVLCRAGIGGAEADSPIRTAVKAGTGAAEGLLERLSSPGIGLGVLMLLAGMTLLFASLRFVTTNMRSVRALHVSGVVAQGHPHPASGWAEVERWTPRGLVRGLEGGGPNSVLRLDGEPVGRLWPDASSRQ